MIEVGELCKVFRVYSKKPGLKGSLQSLLRRQWIVKRAIDNICLKVGKGEIVGLLGANGAGKTTLIKILAGIIYPTSGTARVLGHIPWQRNNWFRSRISLIMGQKAQLWWDLPAADSFLLLREIYQIDHQQYNSRLQQLCSSLDLHQQLRIPLRRLSLGERMKLELVAALLHNPQVIFLDEPTIGLDLSAQRAIRNFILDYQRRYQPAMIVTSHYMEDIERLCRRIVILRKGEIVYDGELKNILENYANHKIMKVRIGNRNVGSSNIENRNVGNSNIENSDALQYPQKFGRVISQEKGYMQLRVPRKKTAEAAAYILKNSPVIDLSIEEEEIGAIIDQIQSRGLEAADAERDAGR